MAGLGDRDLVVVWPRVLAVHRCQPCSEGAEQPSMVPGDVQRLSAAPPGPGTGHLLTPGRSRTRTGRARPFGCDNAPVVALVAHESSPRSSGPSPTEEAAGRLRGGGPDPLPAPPPGQERERGTPWTVLDDGQGVAVPVPASPAHVRAQRPGTSRVRYCDCARRSVSSAPTFSRACSPWYLSPAARARTCRDRAVPPPVRPLSWRTSRRVGPALPLRPVRHLHQHVGCHEKNEIE